MTEFALLSMLDPKEGEILGALMTKVHSGFQVSDFEQIQCAQIYPNDLEGG
eukprot:CAMPEP_0194037062 /NCGR_PEP_ID=MMETSP0009_2-20130614/9415_1 /TAXON_ID=210454 /ORGANISM="Grammatophora oceanica, Strain CCMP 410" /LENGTH=50 /DNA_ID=CAMNT_0038679061 /DNA_START=13 /DNA_END=162 /DNA_ORIENTATION=+